MQWPLPFGRLRHIWGAELCETWQLRTLHRFYSNMINIGCPVAFVVKLKVKTGWVKLAGSTFPFRKPSSEMIKHSLILLCQSQIKCKMKRGHHYHRRYIAIQLQPIVSWMNSKRLFGCIELCLYISLLLYTLLLFLSLAFPSLRQSIIW